MTDSTNEPPRKSPRALRFAEINVGDQLMVSYALKYQTREAGEWVNKVHPKRVEYWIVTDLFFDPVAGEDDPLAGSMVAIKRLDPHTGEPVRGKRSHTIRGLASNGYHYADIDFITQRKLALAAQADGTVINIAKGRIIRARPKLPSSRF